MNITYRQVNDYIIPNLTLPPEETAIRLGKWGLLYKDYLEKQKNLLFTTLLTQGKLYQHCAEVENQAQNMFDMLVEQMKEVEAFTEELKDKNQIEWVQRMNNIQQRAREIVEDNIIFS